ncbi:MAG TPA: MFS transporter [Acidobacteriaceae bacterium]|nr:MFS transporter [Acidobacteriaceae bacterium]
MRDAGKAVEQIRAPDFSGKLGRARWTICAMLFAATTINYVDRQVISILEPTLQHAIGLTVVEYGYIIGGFQAAYAIGVVFAGAIIDRLGTRLGYCLFMGIWALSAMGHSLASSALEFGMARFSLGLGESGNFPAAIKSVAEWFPQKERSLATGIFNSGAAVGAVLAPVMVPWVALHYSWRAAFLITGTFSALWIVWWFRHYRRPGEYSRLSAGELSYIQSSQMDLGPETGVKIPWSRLLEYRQTWAFTLGKFLTDPIWWFFLFWLPSYFSRHFHLDLAHLGLPLIIIYTTSTIGSIGGGWLPAPFRKMGMSAPKARLTAMLVCACAVVPIFTAGFLQSEWIAIGLISLATAAHQGWSANLFTTSSDMFPKSDVASVVGIGTCAGSIGGILLSVGTGWIIRITHTYVILFVLASSAYLLALLIITLLAPGLKKVEVPA